MEQLKFENVRFQGSFFIKNDFSIEETAEIINEVLNLDLEKDDSGYYEELPAYSSHVLGLTFALLGFPDLEWQNRYPDKKYEWYEFHISDYNEGGSSGMKLNLGTYLIAVLSAKSKLICKDSEAPYMKGCVNVIPQ